MKKFLCIVLCMSILFSFTSCAKAQDGDYRVKSKSFSVMRDDLKIRGRVFMPRDKDTLKIAIFSHEFLANQLFMFYYAKNLARSGYACFCYDFCGGGIVSLSQGKHIDMSPLTEVEDLKAVIDYAKKQPYTDNDKVLLVGASQGGLVTALTSADKRDEVSGVVLLYPALCIPRDAKNGTMLGMTFDPENIPDKLKCGPLTFDKKYAEDSMSIDPFNPFEEYDGKVLIIHGDNDSIASLDDSKKAIDVHKEASFDGELYVIKGGKHIFRKCSQRKTASEQINKFAESLEQQ